MENPHVTNAERRLGNAKALLTTAEAETRDLTPDEQTKYDALMADAKRESERAENYRGIDDVLKRYRSSSTPPTDARRTDTALETRAAAPTTERRAIYVPNLIEYRAQATQPGSLGGFVVSTPIWNQVVELLRPRSVMLASRPSLYTMTSSTLSLPLIAVGAVAAWVEENQEIPASDIEFGSVMLTAHKLAARVISSNEWLADAQGGSGREIVERNLTLEIAKVLDEAFFAGDGSGATPTGLLNQPGIPTTSVGGALTLDDLAGAIGRIEANNAVPSAVYMHPAAWAGLRVERDSGSTTGAYLLAPAPSQGVARQVWGVPVYLTPAVGSSAIVADASAIAIGNREGMEILFDPYSLSAKDQTVIRATSRWDIAVLHAEALEILTDIDTPGESES